ncbi:MAG: glycosyltransferase family 2 protein [Rhodothermales bacterium]|nr:glycosyltransferase family 2 protein [Rhodothermales bacterium]
MTTAPADTASRQTLALVIPVFNEEAVVPLLLAEIAAFRATRPDVTQVVFIDDGSEDATVRLLQEGIAGLPGYWIVRFSRNFGHQLAITAGLGVVDADAAVILDADLQDPLHVVDEMMVRWREGFDVVYAIRSRRDGESGYKRWTAALFYRIFRWIADLEMPLDTGDFRLVSRKVIDVYNKIGEQQPFVRGIISWVGFNQIGVSYVRAPRAAGSSKYSLGNMLRFALSGLTSFSDKPLRIVIRLGIGVAVLAVLGLLFAVGLALAGEGGITLGTALIFVGFFFGGVQLLFLGVVGIYLLRVYEAVKGRPRYIVDSHWRSDT